MSKKKIGGGGGGGGGGEAEVEELLRAAEDQVLLNLRTASHSTNSPITSSTPELDPDLARRFDALKSSKIPKGPPPRGDDLSARFAALKGSRGSDLGLGESDPVGDLKKSSEEEDEVEKVMRWAMDAARLDPPSSSKSDDEIGDEIEEDDDDDDDDDYLGEKKKVREKREKGKGKPKKWFFF